MMSPSHYEKRIVAMVDLFTKMVARNFSRNLKRSKVNSEKHYSDEPIDYLLELLIMGCTDTTVRWMDCRLIF